MASKAAIWAMFASVPCPGGRTLRKPPASWAAYGSGVGSYRIAARFGISPATVRARLRAAGVRLRPPRSGLRGPTVAEVAKMRGAGLTVRELARHFGVSHVTILDRLKKAKR